MDRALRRARKALIRARLVDAFEKQAAKWQLRSALLSEERIAQYRRQALRNEGKPSIRRYPCGDTYCDWCIGNKTYRACREAERIEQEWRAWITGPHLDDPITEEELQATPRLYLVQVIGVMQRYQKSERLQRDGSDLGPVSGALPLLRRA